jgi:site-specific recombinase XerD
MDSLTTESESSESIDIDLKELADCAERLKNRAVSLNTLKAYFSDWKKFSSFCAAKHLDPIPSTASTIEAYIAWLVLSKRRYSTIRRHVTSIARIHDLKGFSGEKNPVRDAQIEIILSGASRELAGARRTAEPIGWTLLRKMLSKSGTASILGLRNSALIALGWSAALRRSELAALRFQDLKFCDEGLEVFIRKSKTDQLGIGYKIAIPYLSGDPKYCPVKLVSAWKSRTQLSTGPLFFRLGKSGAQHFYLENCAQKSISEKTVSNIIKQIVFDCGENPDLYSGHSLRRGFATECGRRNIPERIIQRHTRHLSISVLRSYIDIGNQWEENPLPAIWHEVSIQADSVLAPVPDTVFSRETTP